MVKNGESLQAIFLLGDKPIVNFDPKDLIDHPLNEELFGDLDSDEYGALKEDIRKRGIQDPLQVVKRSGGHLVVSGHQRKNIAIELEIDVPCIVRDDLKEDWEIEEQLINDNLLRRHLNDYQKIRATEKLEEIEKRKAKDRMSKGGGDRKSGTQNFADPIKGKGYTRDKVANKVGISGEQYRKAKIVNENAPEKVKKGWKEGKISTHKAYTETVKNERREQSKKDMESNPIPNDDYAVILADPPWKYEFSETKSRSIENKYPSMELEEIKELKVPTGKNAVLFLWATAPKLIECLEVMESWGFQYKTHAIWDKVKMGMGYWFRGQHELLLVGTKGNFSPPEGERRKKSIIKEVRKEHSKKPEKVYEIIEEYFPDFKKIELFARNERSGWISWGWEL